MLPISIKCLNYFFCLPKQLRDVLTQVQKSGDHLAEVRIWLKLMCSAVLLIKSKLLQSKVKWLLVRVIILNAFLLDAVDCEYIETESSDTALLTVAYVMAGVCGLCLLPIFVLLGQASCRRRKQQQQLAAAESPPTDTTSLRKDFFHR